MERKRTALLWDMRIVAQDGRAGKLRGAILAPRADRISHVIVRRGFRKVVTLVLSQATQEADGTLVLHHSGRESAGHDEPRRGSVHFSPRSVVRGTAASVLPVQGFLLDHPGNAVSALLVGSRREPLVMPVDRVKNLRSGSPSAADQERELWEFPSYRPDNEAQVLAERALRSADPTGGDTYGAVRLEVREGTAYLEGHVRLPIQKAEAEQAVRCAPGVLNVENGIATDWDIQIAIAEALAQAGLTRSGTVLVKSSLGNVTLRGNLQSPERIQQASVLAGSTVGVRAVASEIGIVEPPAVQEASAEQEEEGEARESEGEPPEEEASE